MSSVLLKNLALHFVDHRIVKPTNKFIDAGLQKITQDIGKKRLGSKAPRALVIYVPHAIPYYIAGNVNNCPILNSHAMFWEAAEMVRALNERGYIVDFFDTFKPLPLVDWQRYNLVIDERNNLIDAPNVSGQIRAYYCTGLKWDFHNKAELNRIEDFFLRNRILLSPQRQIAPIFSDQLADYLFYWGDKKWTTFFDTKPIRQEITTSVTFVPNKIEDVPSQREFVWLGSTGAIHKGLDLAVEAVSKLKNVTLHIFGSIKQDRLFYAWLQQQMKINNNIQFHGHAEFSSPKFNSIIMKCVGHIYPSCSEGGPGSVAQTSHFGLIPIVTATANVRSAKLGAEIDSTDTQMIIKFIQNEIYKIQNMTDAELKMKREALIDFSKKNHTRKAWSDFFFKFLDQLPRS
jgi:glycosyltransferase involved in cell wall biosynthesis